MTDAERLSREVFYGNMAWVLDGRRFKKNFDIYHGLPDPKSELARDLIWLEATRKKPGAGRGLFFRLSENPAETKTTRSGAVQIHGIHKIQSEVDAAYTGHHQYDWVRAPRTWLSATCPIYIDFGGESLARLEIYDESGLPCIR
jgi:hypothetical protein